MVTRMGSSQISSFRVHQSPWRHALFRFGAGAIGLATIGLLVGAGPGRYNMLLGLVMLAAIAFAVLQQTLP
jgi:hypothetical protein